MNWLRHIGLAYRLRALVLLVSFAIGSLLARDALLVGQLIAIQSEVVEAALGEAQSGELASMPAIDEPAAKVTVRPSGISRRAAMNPWDPPDDDDELDQDSDTVAPTYATLAILPAVFEGLIAAPAVERVPHSADVALRPSRPNVRVISSRGPPV